jgi:putative holliday junction resolvase
MGIDYGDKNIGIAVSDPMFVTSNPLETISRNDEKSIKKSVARIKELIFEYEINLIILGYPKNMNNTEGIRCEKTIEFKDRLERNFKKIHVLLWDERLSSVETYKTLFMVNNNKLSHDKKNTPIDKLAAACILQSYLNYKNKNNIEYGKE